ncbi:formin-like protein 20, partial [Tanacetum coccineum]
MSTLLALGLPGLPELAPKGSGIGVFDCCFSSEVLEEDEYNIYMGRIVAELQDYYPDSSFMVCNFKGDKQTQISDILSQYDMTVMEFPQQYEGGGWPVLAFMLAALLLCGKQYNGEQKTLEMVYKQAPKELLHLLTPLNPQPSQLRYLQYLSRRNLGSDWPPSDTPLALDCIILRFLPYFGKKGCRPVIRINGQDSTLTTANRSSKLLFSSSKSKKHARDVVLECIHLDHISEEMMFRVMFHTAFVRSSILSFSRDEVDGMWDAKGQMAENFRAEVLFSDTIEGESEDVNVEESNKYEEFFEEEEIFKVAEMQHTLLPVESRITSENGDADAGAFKNCTSDDENHKPYTKINDLDHVNGGLNPKGAVANEDGNTTDGRGVKLEEVRSKLDIEEDACKILSRNNLLDKGSTSRPKEWQHLRISFK